MNDDGASSELLLGMAEGKDWADADRAIQENYSKLKDSNVTEKLKIEGFKGLINSWKLTMMLNEELMAVIKMPQHWNDEQIDAELKRQGII